MISRARNSPQKQKRARQRSIYYTDEAGMQGIAVQRLRGGGHVIAVRVDDGSERRVVVRGESSTT